MELIHPRIACISGHLGVVDGRRSWFLGVPRGFDYKVVVVFRLLYFIILYFSDTRADVRRSI